MKPLHRNDTLFLDGIRGLAAFYVLVGHSRWLLWEGYSEGFLNHPQDYHTFEKAIIYFLSAFRYGHEAVLLFFVLSGFVIHLRYASGLKSGKFSQFDFVDFLKRRTKRIVPPLLFAIILTFLIDLLGVWLKLPIYFHQTPYPNINININPDHSLITLLGNISFLMDFYVPVFGTNGPLWSLAYEWWFYMSYPLLFFVLRRSFALASAIVLLLYVGINFSPNKPTILLEVFSFLPVWWMGVLLAEVYVQRISIRFVHLMPLTILLAITPFCHLTVPFHAMNQILWGTGFLGLFSLLFFIQSKGIRLIVLNWLKPLGDISYSLYIIHMPLIVFVSGVLMIDNKDGKLPQTMLYILIGCTISLIVAFVTHQIAEKPFIKKKRNE